MKVYITALLRTSGCIPIPSMLIEQPPATTTTTQPPLTTSMSTTTSLAPVVPSLPICSCSIKSIANCKSVGTIRDETGTSVKGICELSELYNYEDAERECRKYGMNLLVAETSKVFAKIKDYAKRQFTSGWPLVWGHSQGFYIGGEKGFNKDFYSYNSTGIYDVVPLTSYNFIKSTYPGECFVLKNSKGFGVMKYNCGALYPALCEFYPKTK